MDKNTPTTQVQLKLDLESNSNIDAFSAKEEGAKVIDIATFFRERRCQTESTTVVERLLREARELRW